MTRVTRRRTLCWTALLASVLPLVAAQDSAREPSPRSADLSALMQRCSEHEVAALQSPAPFTYLERLEWSWGTETRQVIESAEGRADRIIAFNDQPLAPDQIAKENRRLEKLLHDDKALRHELEEQAAETKRRIRMMEAFASAFFFEAAGEEKGVLKISFRPNRSFSPQNRETQVYRGMQGTVWVEPKQERLVRIDGTLTRDVSFGWGIFGRLYKGGRYVVEQKQVQRGSWRISRLDLQLKLRVFLDTSRLVRREHNFEFRTTSLDTTYRLALEHLLESAGPDR